MARIFGRKRRETQIEDDQASACVDLDIGADEEISGLSQLYCPEQESVSRTRDVADVLAETGKISAEQLSQLRQTQSVSMLKSIVSSRSS